MPRKPDLPCAACGKLMWRGSTSLPEGQARCQPCRAAARGTPPCTGKTDMRRANAAIRAEGRTCLYCGENFTPGRVNQVYCRKNCSRRAHEKASTGRRRPGGTNYRQRVTYDGAWIEHTPRLTVFMRDDWTCQLCGDKVARNEKVPHPKAPTLDHIIPLARGGTHEMANVQTACFVCNSRKGDRITIGAAGAGAGASPG